MLNNMAAGCGLDPWPGLVSRSVDLGFATVWGKSTACVCVRMERCCNLDR